MAVPPKAKGNNTCSSYCTACNHEIGAVKSEQLYPAEQRSMWTKHVLLHHSIPLAVLRKDPRLRMKNPLASQTLF